MSLFGFLKSRGTAPVARERLQILLAHERISVGSSNLLAILRDELLATIARHIEIDPEKLSVKLERAGSVSTLEIDVEVPSDKIGSDARITLDAYPNLAIPAKVSFIATQAQFTPKTVETKDEREKLMFRVKLQLDAEVLKQYSRRVKTGVRGLGVMRTNTATAWPEDLQVKLP